MSLWTAGALIKFSLMERGKDVIICENCGHDNPEGALICIQCGAKLTHAIDSALGTKELGETDDSVGKPHWGTARFSHASMLIIHIRDSNEPIVMEMQDELVLGRYDPVSRTRPDLDLSPFQAVDKGVSRLHAAIRRQDDSLNVIDLGSANSTYLNGQRLVPHQPRVLRDGDELRLGMLVLHIYFRHDNGG